MYNYRTHLAKMHIVVFLLSTLNELNKYLLFCSSIANFGKETLHYIFPVSFLQQLFYRTL